MANAPYNVSTLVGQTRFHAADTDVPDAFTDNTAFSDAEIGYALSISSNDPLLAASYLLEAAAVDSAKLALMIRIGHLQVDEKDLSGEIAARAKTLRGLSNGGVLVISTPDLVFSTNSGGGMNIGTMTGW